MPDAGLCYTSSIVKKYWGGARSSGDRLTSAVSDIVGPFAGGVTEGRAVGRAV